MRKSTRNPLSKRTESQPRFRGTAIVLSVIALWATTSGAFAQGGGGGGPRVVPGAGPVSIPLEQPVAAEPRFDLRFEGGTVADYLEAIQNASGRRNIVAMANTDRVHMPRVQLDDVNTQAAVSVLNGMAAEAEPGVAARVFVNTRLDVVAVYVEIDGAKPSSTRTQPPRRETAVHGLAEMLLNGGYTIDAILSAIDVALEMSGGSDAKLRYHEETRMLFVHGTGLDHVTVLNVLEELKRQATMMPREEMSEVDWIKQQIADTERALQREQDALRVIYATAQVPIRAQIEKLKDEIAILEDQVLQGEERPTTKEEIGLKFRALERAMIEEERIETQIRNANNRLDEFKVRREGLYKDMTKAQQP